MMLDRGSRLCEIAGELGFTLGSRERDRLLEYLALLQRWNGVYNLTAVRDPEAMLTQHLADCMAVIPALERVRPAGRLLDVGSGGGLPGVVIATLMADVDVTCVDTVGKKVAFLRQVAGTLGLPNLHAMHGRVESLQALQFDVIASRAFATLADFTRLTEGLLSSGGVWMAMKGRVPDDEITALRVEIEMFHVEPLIVPGLDGQRCLVWMRKRQRA